MPGAAKNGGEDEEADGTTLIRFPKALLPYVLGAALGGGGTFGVTSFTRQEGLTEADLKAIKVVVVESITAYDASAKVEHDALRLDIAKAVLAHEAKFHASGVPEK